jgi:hypothetical protein
MRMAIRVRKDSPTASRLDRVCLPRDKPPTRGRRLSFIIISVGPPRDSEAYFFRFGSFLRFVLAMSRSCFSDIDFAICFEAPFRLDFFRSPRFAANAAPAAICCFFERAGISVYRSLRREWLPRTLSPASKNLQVPIRSSEPPS